MPAISVSELCMNHQMNVQELSERSQLDEQRVLAIVMGRWTPSPVERKKIAEVFELEIDEISWGHRTPIQHIYGFGPS
ncbi:MAG: hypothetical protein Tsb009_06740 [Planctomycetaceae bacterium]